MKNVYKILPVSLFDIPGLEQWLEKQANLGLSPTHLGSYAAFARNGVPGTRYRLEPWGKAGTEPTPEQVELYQNSGWEYAFSIARAYFLFYTTDPDAPELYSDLATRGQSLDRLAKQIKRTRVKRLILPVLAVVTLFASLLWPVSRFDVQPDRWASFPLLLLYLMDPMLLFFVITAALQMPREFREYHILLNTHEALKSGLIPQPSQISGKKITFGNITQFILLPILVLCLILYYFIPQKKPLSQFELPYVSLSDMENEPLTTYEGLFGYDSRISADENQARRQFSLLAPVWYEVSQSGYSLQSGTQKNTFSTDPEDGKYRYSPDLNMTRFFLLIPAMSRSVARSQLDAYRADNLFWAFEEVDYPGTDFVILAQEDSGVWQMAALGSGKYVAVFRYGGQEKLADHLDLLSSMVNP